MTDRKPAVTLTKRFDAAVKWARKGFAPKSRKQVEGDAAPAVPYLCHLLEVAGIVLDHGGDETAAIAGLLHDAAEDLGGKPVLRKIGERFGGDVRRIVRDLSDDFPPKDVEKAPWWERKVVYVDRLRGVPDATLLVCGADKLSNIRASRSSFRSFPDEAFTLSKHGRRAGTLWYYDAVIAVLEERGFDPQGLTSTLRSEYDGWVDAVRAHFGDAAIDEDLRRASDDAAAARAVVAAR